MSVRNKIYNSYTVTSVEVDRQKCIKVKGGRRALLIAFDKIKGFE